METSAAEDDGKVTLEGGGAPRAKGIWLVRLARHFVGIRDRRYFPTPLVRPLRHLSPTTEGYVLGFLGSFPSILIACGISLGLSTIPSSAFSATPLTVGSLGATAVLLYAIPEGPLSQPRNLVGGHLLCAVTGAVISQLFSLSSRFDIDEAIDNEVAMQGSWQHLNPVAAALAVGIAVFGMQITGTVHPPGGATALIASYIRTTSQRWTYVLDVFLSVSAMGVWAMVVGNIGRRRYPAYWWTPNPPPAPDPEPSIPVPISPKKQPSERRPSSGARSVESPAEDLDRRWLGRLGEVDEEALAEGDELARREEERWLARERKLEEDEAERGRRATRR
ncbi:HPP family-domain-containing protein [Rhodotorula diobovata]|uniref:HPP family-domain-containing protein n=1 Tax=Rhodotorula diobovata TaxID=5288 RepID=A0A5C5FXW9_9BASI|nr:HPP family-domain-containing protein [Rhodotorula diobovata]